MAIRVTSIADCRQRMVITTRPHFQSIDSMLMAKCDNNDAYPRVYTMLTDVSALLNVKQDGGGHHGGIGGGGGGGGGSMGPSALDNMRSLEYYLHDMMHNPHDGHDPCKGDYPVTFPALV